MPRQPDERYEQAKEMYLRGLKLVEISKNLEIPEGTVRRWKSTHNWDSERSDKKSERSDKKKIKKIETENDFSEQVAVLCENSDLSDKQRLFCCLYIKYFNATKAYQKAYQCGYETALVAGPRLLGNVRIKNEIQRLKQNRLNKEMLAAEDIFQKYMDIAFADITDYVEFGREKVQVMGAFGPLYEKDENTGGKIPITKEVNVVRFVNSKLVDGTIISEVKQGKDGASIKLADRMKALQWLSDHLDMANDEQKAKVALLKARTDRLTGNNQEIEDLGDIEEEIYGSG